jgi:hypothetical protein
MPRTERTPTRQYERRIEVWVEGIDDEIVFECWAPPGDINGVVVQIRNAEGCERVVHKVRGAQPGEDPPTFGIVDGDVWLSGAPCFDPNEDDPLVPFLSWVRSNGREPHLDGRLFVHDQWEVENLLFASADVLHERFHVYFGAESTPADAGQWLEEATQIVLPFALAALYVRQHPALHLGRPKDGHERGVEDAATARLHAERACPGLETHYEQLAERLAEAAPGRGRHELVEGKRLFNRLLGKFAKRGDRRDRRIVLEELALAYQRRRPARIADIFAEIYRQGMLDLRGST